MPPAWVAKSRLVAAFATANQTSRTTAAKPNTIPKAVRIEVMRFTIYDLRITIRPFVRISNHK